ncbi:hypothetical protein QJQ45_001743 [Haematococcus lacustris]|nr:hypothetical protein QJQ45_001743 [Haematococcus lacustris]
MRLARRDHVQAYIVRTTASHRYDEHAQAVWPDLDNRPTIAETLAHNKSCRTAASSRDYARQRRELLRLQPGCSEDAGDGSTIAQSWEREEGSTQRFNKQTYADQQGRHAGVPVEGARGHRQRSVQSRPDPTSHPTGALPSPMALYAWPASKPQATAFVCPNFAGLPCGLYLVQVKAMDEALPEEGSQASQQRGPPDDEEDVEGCVDLPLPLMSPSGHWAGSPSPPPWQSSPQLPDMAYPNTTLAAPCGPRLHGTSLSAVRTPCPFHNALLAVAAAAAGEQ